MVFGNKNRQISARSMPATQLDHLVSGIQSRVNSQGSRLSTVEVARAAISLESIDPGLQAELDTTSSSLSAALEGIATAVNGNVKYQQSQIQAATAAGIMASDINSFLRAPVQQQQVAMEGVKYVNLGQIGTPDIFDSRMKVALEAYDEKDNKNAVTYSVAYNMQAARQDAFGEMFFPTIVVTPDQVGFAISIRLIAVYDEQRRQISGDYNDFGKRNIIDAVIDPTILRNDTTKIVPIYRDESKKHFVSTDLFTPREVEVGPEKVVTAPLKMGATFSLLGISQTEALLETGLLDSTDSIDTAVSLTNLYMKVPGATADLDELIPFSTDRLPLATFTYAVQGNYRMMLLNFTSDSLLLNAKTTKQIDGTPSALLAALIAGEYSIRLGVKVSGGVNLELAETNLYSAHVVVKRVTTKDGLVVSNDDASVKAIVELLEKCVLEGFDLSAHRTNLNRRERGQLLDTTFYSQVYTIPLRSPITVPRPLTLGDANDASDLAALITATHIRTSNAAVDELLRVQAVLADYVDSKDIIGNAPEIMGVSHYLVKAFCEHDDLDVSTVIDSIKSHERAADIQAVLVNKIRDMAFRMYRDSGYKAAADALAGGVAPMPTVIIGTDPVIARYLQVTGDLRTLGGGLDVKIESTLNRRMAGKIIMSFGVFSEGQEGVPNPMHFGNMGWKPELTLVLPLHRNGANSKELTVQPSFLHITHLPIMASLNISGIPDVVSEKVAVNMHTV